jgi:hypothetical protein
MKNLKLYYISFFFFSCTSSSQFVKFPTEPVNSNGATVYVINPRGVLSHFSVFENETLIGKIGSNGYVKWNIPEGQSKISVNPVGANLQSTSNKGAFSLNQDYFTINAKMGVVYYLKANYTIKQHGLILLDPTEGERIIRKLKKPTVSYSE